MTPNGVLSGKLAPHLTFFLADGTLLVPLTQVHFKVHRTLLTRHSPTLESWISESPRENPPSEPPLHTLNIPASVDVAIGDFEVLLEHLYHDAPLDSATPFPRLAALLRVTSSKQLDLPPIHTRARTHISALFPGGPAPFAHLHPPEHLEPALELAMTFDLGSETKKALLYSVASSTNFDPAGAHDPAGPEEPDAARPLDAPPPPPHPALSPRTLRVCHRVLGALIADFTPVLFTVGAAGHMGCTDAIADRWMGEVIAPAIADGGVGRPLEELARIAARPWGDEGVCVECVKAKKGELEGVAAEVWDKFGVWVVDAEKAEGNQ